LLSNQLLDSTRDQERAL